MSTENINLDDLEQVIKDRSSKESEAGVLLDTSRIKLLTRLSREEITDISTLYYIAEILELGEFENLLTNLVHFKVSEGGKGRKEIVDVLKGHKPSLMQGFGGGQGRFN